MQNLISILLIKMAKVDAQSKELIAQVDAQSLVLAALFLTLSSGEYGSITINIRKAMIAATAASKEILQSDADLLLIHITRIISISHLIESHPDSLAGTPFDLLE